MKNRRLFGGLSSVALAGTVLFSFGGLFQPVEAIPLDVFRLVEVDSVNENTITKFEYNNETGEYVAKNYMLELQRNFSNSDTADTTVYYKYTDTGVIKASADDYDFSYSYDSKKNSNNVVNPQGTTIDNLSGNFIGHDVAIENSGTVNNISGVFLDNKYGILTFIDNTYRETITPIIENINADFINSQHGAIIDSYYFKNSEFRTIKGNFIGNGDNTDEIYSMGGGLINVISADSIEGNFIKNNIQRYPGAVIVRSRVKSINGNFIQNNGSAISLYPNATNDSITGNFIENTYFWQSKYNGLIYTQGGDGAAINNEGQSNLIDGVFIKNTAGGSGGAIYNVGLIKKVKGLFSENKAFRGGAINNGDSNDYYAYGNFPLEIDEITGDFFKNKAVYGGAIYNYDETLRTNPIINKITDSNFIENEVSHNYYESSGGAIENFGEIKEISKTNFIKNKANVGGAITNDRTLVAIENVNFLNNEAQGYANRTSSGGAIENRGTIDKISNTNFDSNHTTLNNLIIKSSDKLQGPDFKYTIEEAGNENQGGKTQGGAISNFGTVKEISNVSFLNNYSSSKYGNAFGGAMFNGPSGKIEKIDGVSFLNNSATDFGGGIYNKGDVININNSIFMNNSALIGGGLYNENYIDPSQAPLPDGSETGGYYYLLGETIVKNDGTKVTLFFPFEGLDAFKQSVLNGRRYIVDIVETTEDEIIDYGYGSVDDYINDLLADSGTFEDLEKYYNENNVFNKPKFEEINKPVVDKNIITNTSFINNKANEGSAIYSEQDVALKAENGGFTVVSGNKKLDGTDGSAIYMKDGANLLLEANTGGTIKIDDKISGNVPYLVYISGDMSGKVLLNNSLENGTKVVLDNTNLKLGKRDDIFKGGDLMLKSGFIDVANGNVGQSALSNFSLAGQVKTTADVDLRNEVMDRFTAEKYAVKDSANLDVIRLNLLSDTAESDVKILYADEAFAKNVTYSGGKFAYTPIKKYEIGYFVDENDNNGYFRFNSAKGKGYQNFNPAVYSSPVSASAGIYASQLGVFNYAFRHSDAFMNLNSMQRLSAINSDKYAQGAIVDSGVFSPLYTKLNEEGGWIRPYTNFESIPLSNGPKVSSISYGTLVGMDSDLKDLKKGFKSVLTGYLGYNGASQNYEGVNTILNGGLLGFTETLYKNKFFNATTVSAGGGITSSSTMYGDDRYPYISAGIANKTGYNFEFRDGRIIFQPNFLFVYTFINTFDYTASSGVRIDSKPINAFQVSPGFKLIGNTKNGWQPYLSLAMIWNINDKQKAYANNIALPSFGIKPYVQYGLGVQKLFNQDKMTVWGQALVTNGGINGVGLSFGLRYLFGKDSTEVKGEIKDEKL